MWCRNLIALFLGRQLICSKQNRRLHQFGRRLRIYSPHTKHTGHFCCSLIIERKMVGVTCERIKYSIPQCRSNTHRRKCSMTSMHLESLLFLWTLAYVGLIPRGRPKDNLIDQGRNKTPSAFPRHRNRQGLLPGGCSPSQLCEHRAHLANLRGRYIVKA